MQDHTYAAHFRTHYKKEALLYDSVMIIGATIFIALSAQFAFSVPFSPVPITGQSFAVILTGALLGSRRGALAVILYLLEGISGIPVFAQAQAGLIYLFGPTGGYLLGFIPAAFLTGSLAEKGWGKNLLSAIAMMTIGIIVIFVSGLSVLTVFFDDNNLLAVGLYPFLPGAIIKIIFSALVFRFGWHLIKNYRKDQTK